MKTFVEKRGDATTGTSVITHEVYIMKAFVDGLKSILSSANMWFIFFGLLLYFSNKYTKQLETDLANAKATIQVKENQIQNIKSSLNNYLIANGEFNKPAKYTIPLLKKFDLIQENQ